MKSRGVSIIFVNSSNEILLFLRDNRPDIPFPNRWDLLGGAVEPEETASEGIIREIKEEIDYTVVDPQLFRVTEFDDRLEYTFIEPVDLNIQKTHLSEGQRLKWFSKDEFIAIEPNAIAFGFRPLLLSFFAVQPSPE
jgi:8-oxo-dGTP diphosphatase